MSALSNLKLVVSAPAGRLPVAVVRRNKLVAKLDEQIMLATAYKDGSSYEAQTRKKVVDAETGERRTVTVPKRLKAWWRDSDNGKLNVSVRYGAKVVELAKGKNAVEVANAADLVDALQVLRQAVIDGELDTQIEAASGAVKAGFKR